MRVFIKSLRNCQDEFLKSTIDRIVCKHALNHILTHCPDKTIGLLFSSFCQIDERLTFHVRFEKKIFQQCVESYEGFQ